MHRAKESLVDSIALGAILVAAGARAMIAFASIPVFDMDPALEAGAFVGAGPAESVLFDALSLAGSAWLLWKVAMAGSSATRTAAGLLALAAPAIAIGLFHAVGDAEQLWRGVTWIAALISAIAIFSATRRDGAQMLRRASVCALCGIAVVMAMRGLSQMISEHSSMVAYYNETRDHFLAAQGWLPDSPQALSYERRLLQNEATGWLGFSNVFATIAAASAVLMANMALGKGRLAARAIAGCAVALCAGLIVASGSKGGVAALAIGVVVSLLMRRWDRMGRVLLVSLPLLVIIGILARGGAGAQLGEHSLLFRWYYLIGAAKTLALWPWTGVGPAGFQTAFLQTRPSECAEEVLSAHCATADWLAAFGIAALGWIAIEIAMAWWCGALKSESRPSDESPNAAGERSPCAQLAVGVVAFSSVISIGFEAPALDDLAGYLWRVGGLACGAIVAWACVKLLESGAASAHRAVALGLAGLCGAVIAHGQIDMVFWLPGSGMWAWVALAVAAAWNAPVEESTNKRAPSSTPRTIVICASIGATIGAAVLALVVRPAIALQDEAAFRAAANLNTQAQAQSSHKLAQARAQAATALDEAAKIWPHRGWYEVRAAEQWQGAASGLPTDSNAGDWIRQAGIAARSASQLNSARFAALLVNSTVTIRAESMGEASIDDAIEAIASVLALNPRHVESWIRLADAYSMAGRRDASIHALREALAADESYWLDPLRQLPLQRREAIEARIRELGQ